jgi:peptide/nickel transport system permease protein
VTAVTGLVVSRRASRRPGALVFGIVVLACLVAIGILGPWVAPHDPFTQNLAGRRVPPAWFHWLYNDRRANWDHLLGTDNLGRDYLSRTLYGLRISLMIGASAMVISGIIGSTLGMAAGYFRGWVDAIIGFLVTTRLSIPIVLVALCVVSLYGGSKTIITLVLGLLLWDRFAVVMRSVTMQACRQDYVAAAKAIGCSDLFILFSEILPNLAAQLAIVASVEMSTAILIEAALSFLGLGVPPPEPSLGLMLSDARTEMLFSSWMIGIPGTVLFVLVIAINLIGDGIRDLVAPREAP